MPTRAKKKPGNRIKLVYAISGLGEKDEVLPEGVEVTPWLQSIIDGGFAIWIDGDGEQLDTPSDDDPAV